MQNKFKVGDTITPSPGCCGYENATVLNILTEKKGKKKGREYYVLSILNGTATIPTSAEVNYRLYKPKKGKQ